MKKTPAKKKVNTKKAQVSAAKSTVKPVAKKTCMHPWSLSIYVYWFIILFFIASTFYILGRAHNMPKLTDDSAEVTEEVLKMAEDYYKSGEQKLVAGNIEEAIADLTTAIDSDAATVSTYTLRGEAYMQMGDYRNAMADFDKAIEMDPMYSVAYYDRSLLNTRLEDYNAALIDINNAMAVEVKNPSSVLASRDMYAKRGRLNLWLKNWEGAIADFTNSLARPNGVVTPDVYAERAEAYTAMAMYNEAIADYTSAVRVISEQIQGLTDMNDRERLSAQAMNYFEKSAALNLKQGDIVSAKDDLNSARTIAAALADEETISRLDTLIADLNKM
ncbi:MAG: tetratricopeptide repeat protein [Alphaproteobacteria bacterium]|nr:tetratricopeptide repeat protein [Alphaproteobacteria bacterium]